MRRFGRFLSWLGVAIGVAVGVSLFIPWNLAGGSWILAVGIAKFTFVSALGLIGAGAVVQRVAIRGAERAALPPVTPH